MTGTELKIQGCVGCIAKEPLLAALSLQVSPQNAGGAPDTGMDTDPWFARAVASEKPGPVLGVRNGVRATTAELEPLYTAVMPSLVS
jgi:hypothetical protein